MCCLFTGTILVQRLYIWLDAISKGLCIAISGSIIYINASARVAKQAYARDLKSLDPNRSCGFKSRPGHHIKC